MRDPVRDVLAAMTEVLITPTVAQTGALDDHIQAVKLGVVQYLVKHTDAAKDVLARHFDRSDRWVYQMLSECQKAAAEEAPPTGKDGSWLMREILQFFQRKYPEGGTSAECHAHLVSEGKWKMTQGDLEGFLKFYADMGLLTRDATGAEPQYRAPQYTNTTLAEPAEYQQRLDMVKFRLRPLAPLLQAFVQAAPGAGLRVDSAMVLQSEYETAAADIRRYVIERVQRAVLNSIEADPDERGEKVEFSVLTIVGPGRKP